MKQIQAIAFIAVVLMGATGRLNADTTVTVDPAAGWNGFMNVFQLPANGGAFVFNGAWGTADLTAKFGGNALTLGPNTIGDPDPFWYVGGGAPGNPGNKNMDANMYVERTGTLSGQTVTFQGTVLSNTLISPYTSVAFIKDFAPDFSSFNTITAPLTPGPFSVSLATLAGAGRHVQYGFETIGPNVWITDAGPVGTVRIAAVPEPAMVTIVGIAACCALGYCRRR